MKKYQLEKAPISDCMAELETTMQNLNRITESFEKITKIVLKCIDDCGGPFNPNQPLAKIEEKSFIPNHSLAMFEENYAKKIKFKKTVLIFAIGIKKSCFSGIGWAF